MLSRQYYVRVIGQNKHIAGVYFFNCLQYRIDTWVHRLAALNYRACAQILENGADSATCGYSHQADFLFAFLELSLYLAVLLAHILDLYLVDFTELKRHLQYSAGTVGVNVYLNKACIARNNDRITDFDHLISEFLKRLICKRID